MEKDRVLHLNKLESPLPKYTLCQILLKLAQWFWRGNFFNFINVFSLFCYHLPFGKAGVLHLNKLESPTPKNALCQVSLKLAQWLTTTTYNWQILIRKAHLSLPLRWAKSTCKHSLGTLILDKHYKDYQPKIYVTGIIITWFIHHK